jgi:hypothetical protein
MGLPLGAIAAVVVVVVFVTAVLTTTIRFMRSQRPVPYEYDREMAAEERRLRISHRQAAIEKTQAEARLASLRCEAHEKALGRSPGSGSGPQSGRRPPTEPLLLTLPSHSASSVRDADRALRHQPVGGFDAQSRILGRLIQADAEVTTRMKHAAAQNSKKYASSDSLAARVDSYLAVGE